MRSTFPVLCPGRWPNLADQVHCPFSIVINSPMLSLGRSPERLWLCLESSTATWGSASFHPKGPQQIKAPAPFPVLSGAKWVHMHTHTTPSSWVPPAKGRRPFPVTQCISNKMVQGPPMLRRFWKILVQKLFNTHKFNST